MRFREYDKLSAELVKEMWEDMKDDTRQHPSITDLIYCLTKVWYSLHNPIDPPPDAQLRMAIGLGLEQVLLVKRRGEGTVGSYEGIHYHIDSLMGSDGIPLMEFKTTRAKASQTPEDFNTGWLRQILGYMKTQGWTSCSLSVLFIIPAVMKSWVLEFDQEEVDDNWRWLQERKQVLDRAIADNQAPREYAWNLGEWECRDCPYSGWCEARKAARRMGVES